MMQKNLLDFKYYHTPLAISEYAPSLAARFISVSITRNLAN